MRKKTLFSITVVGVAVAVIMLIPITKAQGYTIPGTSNIYGAGHSGANATPFPGGSSPGSGPSGGTAPVTVSVVGYDTLTIVSTGTVSFGPSGLRGPDGYSISPLNFASYNGIAGFRIDRNVALYGVFTGVTEPTDPAPSRLDFVGNTSFSTFSPGLNQIFFIGDGLTGTGTGSNQVFIIPTGTTSLALGFADGYPVGQNGWYLPGGYNDNTGSLQVNIVGTVVPEPLSSILFITGGTLLAGRRFIRKKA